MPRGRSYTWDIDQSNRPVIIERKPDFANLFKSRKRSVRIVPQESHIRQRQADYPEVVEAYEQERERRRSGESTSMSRGGRQDVFIPLPPRIPINHQAPDPVVEVVSPRRRQRPEVHQLPRNTFDLPMNQSPVLVIEPERIIARERDRRREADRLRKKAEEETERVHRAAMRERERRRQAEDIAQQISREVNNERENRREVEERARRLAAEVQEAEARIRQVEYELARERQLGERERAVRERRIQAEREARAEAEAEAQAQLRRPVQIIQRDLPIMVDRGAQVLRQAQEAERRRREDELLFHDERARHHHLPRRQHSITIFEDDDARRRHRHH